MFGQGRPERRRGGGCEIAEGGGCCSKSGEQEDEGMEDWMAIVRESRPVLVRKLGWRKNHNGRRHGTPRVLSALSHAFITSPTVAVPAGRS